MNSHWIENLIIFTMMLFSTRSNGQIKIMVSRARRESTWSKLPKISEKLRFNAKLWKVLFYDGFDLIWPSVNPRLTKGILVILVEKGTSGTPASERVASHHSGCPRGPMGRKIMFLDFLGFDTQIEGEQNIVSTVINRLATPLGTLREFSL